LVVISSILMEKFISEKDLANISDAA